MSVIENKKPSTIVEGFSHIIALIPSNTKPIINPQTAPFTRIHCKSLPTLFSIISINVLSSNLSRFSCTSFPIFEWLFSTSFTTCFCNQSSIFEQSLRHLLFYSFVLQKWNNILIRKFFIVYKGNCFCCACSNISLILSVAFQFEIHFSFQFSNSCSNASFSFTFIIS